MFSPRNVWIGTIVLLLAFAGCRERAAVPATVVYLVRHAEKASDGTNDPPLTDAGCARARALAHVLQDAGIKHVHSSPFQRTRQTARPLADTLGLSIEAYDPLQLGALADEIRRTGGVHLVVGHSNTTPALAQHLGGDPGPPIAETEYDRLYLLVLTSDGGVTTAHLRFGEVSKRMR